MERPAQRLHRGDRGPDRVDVLAAYHWLGHSDDHLLHGDTVHEVIGRQRDLRLQRSLRSDGFRLDSWAQA